MGQRRNDWIFGGNTDHVTFGLGLILRLGGGCTIFRDTGFVGRGESSSISLFVLTAIFQVNLG